ncbi:hypothetical protein V1504DRAFT_500848 [Lipomyces starkeyi]
MSDPPRTSTPGSYSGLSEVDLLTPTARPTTTSTPIPLSHTGRAKSVQHRPRKRRALGVFDILKRDYSELIDRECFGKLHSTSCHRIKERAQRMSEQEKEALKENAVDPEVALSHLYANMLAEMVNEKIFTVRSSIVVTR